MTTTVISSNVVGSDIPVLLSSGDQFILTQSATFVTWTTGYAAGIYGDALSPGASVTILGTFIGPEVVLFGGDRLAVGRLGSMQTGVAAGIVLQAEAASAATTVVNEGTIHGHFLPGSAAFTVTVGDAASTGATGFSLLNTGLIEANGAALVLSGIGRALVTNSGTIQGDILAGNGALRLQNSGTIWGSVTGGLGDDSLVSAGMISGAIDMGAGNDLIDLRHGTLLGATPVQGGLGDDSFVVDRADLGLADAGGIDTVWSSVDFALAAGFERLTLLEGARIGTGNADANLLTGNATGNLLAGDTGDDTILGMAGADTLLGEQLGDLLDGGAGNDLLYGGSGRDTLYGGAGEDVLYGGTGRESLSGGEDGDTFVFTRPNQSPDSAADILLDFTPGEDRIDLSAIDANAANGLAHDAFTFIGSGPFTHVAGQLRYEVIGTQTWVRMDLTGDGLSDMALRLMGAPIVSASDFVL